MRHLKHFSVILFAVTAIFVFAHEDSHKSLADLYRNGRVRFIPELTLDDSLIPEDVFFESPLLNIAVGKKGNIYILDYKANNIKKFNSSGKFIKTIGRHGQGPGEFDRPYLLTFARGRLIVWDQGNRRLCTLTPDGDYIKSIDFQLMEGRLRKMNSLANGDIVIETEMTYYGEPNKPQDCTIKIYSPDLKYKKTLYTKKVWRNRFIAKPILTNVPQPFSPLVCWDVSPDGKIIIGFSEKYKIEIYDPIKGKIASFSHTYKPVKVTKKDIKDFFNNLFSVNSVEGTKRGVPDYIIKNTEFPKYKPAFKKLLVDSEGNILIIPYRKNKAKEYRYFDAFDQEGNFIQKVQVIGDIFFPSFPDIRIVKNSFWLGVEDNRSLIKVVKYKISD